MFGSSLPPTYLRYVYLLAHSGVQTHIVLCFCFVCRRLICPVVPVSLDFPFLIASLILSDVYLHNNCMLSVWCRVQLLLLQKSKTIVHRRRYRFLK